MNKNETFENYLMEVHCRENPELLKDQLIDGFDDWLGELEIDDVIKYADEFAIQEFRKGFNQCLKDNKLTGEKHQGKYL